MRLSIAHDAKKFMRRGKVVKNAAQKQNENIISHEDVIASGNDNGANAMNDEPSESSDFKLRDARAPENDKDKRQVRHSSIPIPPGQIMHENKGVPSSSVYTFINFHSHA